MKTDRNHRGYQASTRQQRFFFRTSRSSGLESALLFWSQCSKATPVFLAGRAHDSDAFEQKPVLDIPLKFVEERLRASGNDLLGQRVYLNQGSTNQAVRFLNIPTVIQ